jgi:hypothetical protein
LKNLIVLPAAALSPYPKYDPHNRLISAANIVKIFYSQPFIGFFCGASQKKRPRSAQKKRPKTPTPKIGI